MVLLTENKTLIALEAASIAIEAAKSEDTIVFYDLETTIPLKKGEVCELLEFGAVVVTANAFRELASFCTLIQPSSLLKVSKRSTECNGITSEDVAKAPFLADVAHAIYSLLHGRVWGGHNIICFDNVKLRDSFNRISKPPPEPKAIVDTLPLLRKTFGTRAGNLKMATLGAHFGLGIQSHRSLDDVRMNIQILKHCSTILLLESHFPHVFPPSTSCTTLSNSKFKSKYILIKEEKEKERKEDEKEKVEEEKNPTVEKSQIQTNEESQTNEDSQTNDESQSPMNDRKTSPKSQRQKNKETQRRKSQSRMVEISQTEQSTPTAQKILKSNDEKMNDDDCASNLIIKEIKEVKEDGFNVNERNKLCDSNNDNNNNNNNSNENNYNDSNNIDNGDPNNRDKVKFDEKDLVESKANDLDKNDVDKDDDLDREDVDKAELDRVDMDTDRDHLNKDEYHANPPILNVVAESAIPNAVFIAKSVIPNAVSIAESAIPNGIAVAEPVIPNVIAQSAIPSGVAVAESESSVSDFFESESPSLSFSSDSFYSAENDGLSDELSFADCSNRHDEEGKGEDEKERRDEKGEEDAIHDLNSSMANLNIENGRRGNGRRREEEENEKENNFNDLVLYGNDDDDDAMDVNKLDLNKMKGNPVCDCLGRMKNVVFMYEEDHPLLLFQKHAIVRCSVSDNYAFGSDGKLNFNFLIQPSFSTLSILRSCEQILHNLNHNSSHEIMSPFIFLHNSDQPLIRIKIDLERVEETIACKTQFWKKEDSQLGFKLLQIENFKPWVFRNVIPSKSGIGISFFVQAYVFQNRRGFRFLANKIYVR